MSYMCIQVYIQVHNLIKLPALNYLIRANCAQKNMKVAICQRKITLSGVHSKIIKSLKIAHFFTYKGINYNKKHEISVGFTHICINMQFARIHKNSHI